MLIWSGVSEPGRLPSAAQHINKIECRAPYGTAVRDYYERAVLGARLLLYPPLL